ncbi:MAG: acyltransferase [Thermodesulfobacteriota bacterium]
MSHFFSRIKILPLFVTVAFSLLLASFLSESLHSTTSVTVTMALDHTDVVKIYYKGKGGRARYSEKKVTTEQLLHPGKTTFKLYPGRGSAIMASIRLDPGSYPGKVELFEIIIHRPLAEDIKLGPEELAGIFTAGKDSVGISQASDHLEIASTAEDPYIISRPLDSSDRKLGLSLIPLIIGAFFFYLGLCRLHMSRFLSLLHPARILPTNQSYVMGFDGLRAIAAVMVIGDHTWGRCIGLGTSGVFIFFTLSGFLLGRPLVRNLSGMNSVDSLVRYGEKRLRRIMPMYVFYILIVYVASLRLGDGLLHLLFLKADAHLWAVQQEMFFYLLFPLLPLVFSRIPGSTPLLNSGLLVLLFVLLYTNIIPPLRLYGMGRWMYFYLEIFLGGVILAYIYSLFEAKTIVLFKRAWFKNSMGLIGLLILTLFILFSNGRLLGHSVIYSQHYSSLFGLGAVLVVFSVLMAGDSFVGRLFSLGWLRSIGIVSYSIYLLHPLLINIVDYLDEFYLDWGLHGLTRIFVILLISYPVACLTYRTIEVPFLQRSKTTDQKKTC